MSVFPENARTPWPSDLSQPNTLPEFVRQELQQLVSDYLGAWLSDHKGDGTHGYVRADGLSSENGLQEFGRSLTMGQADLVEWYPSMFSASGTMTWTVTAGNVTNVRAALIGGNLLYFGGQLAGTNVGGVAGAELRIALPFKMKALGRGIGQLLYVDAGAAFAHGYALTGADQSYLGFNQTAGGNWTLTAASNTTVNFFYLGPVVPNPLVA